MEVRPQGAPAQPEPAVADRRSRRRRLALRAWDSPLRSSRRRAEKYALRLRGAAEM